MVKGIIGGLIAAVIGAGVWAAIAYFTGYEIGWIAWGIGALVGFVAAKAAGDDAGDGLGIVAAVIAVLAILGGKYAVGHAQATKYFAEHPPVKFTDSLMISLEARTIAEKMEQRRWKPRARQSTGQQATTPAQPARKSISRRACGTPHRKHGLKRPNQDAQT
jgi:phosphate/sulfate permease